MWSTCGFLPCLVSQGLAMEVEEAGGSPRPETPSTLTETEGEMEGGLLEVDLDSYQATLEEVLTWLLSAEDSLHMQDEVSDDVEEVKEQFHTHEVGGDAQAEMHACMQTYIGINNHMSRCLPVLWNLILNSCTTGIITFYLYNLM